MSDKELSKKATEDKTMRASFLVWCKSRYHDGNRDTADTLNRIYVDCGGLPPLRVAMYLNEHGMLPQSAKMISDALTDRIAAGHGITIIYPSGKHRKVRGVEKY